MKASSEKRKNAGIFAIGSSTKMGATNAPAIENRANPTVALLFHFAT